MKHPHFLLTGLILLCTGWLTAQNTFTITGYSSPTCDGGCSGSITITVSGSTTPASGNVFIWSNGTTTQNLFNLCPGTYTVTVSSANGITATNSFMVRSQPGPILDIYSSNTAPCNFDSFQLFKPCERVCPFTTVTYSLANVNPSGTQGTGWQVSGASSFVINPFPSNSVTVNWGPPGNGSVNVFVDNSLCPGESTKCVTIIEPPKAAFVATPAPVKDTIEVCIGQMVYFDNKSKDSDRYNWYFSDDLSKSAEVHPSHRFNVPGLYEVKLVASSDCLCSDTTRAWVRVLDAKAPALDCVGTICPGTSVTYTATGACAPFTWNISANGTVLSGGTAQSDSITILWNDGPAGTISLAGKACSGAECPKPAGIRVPIISDNAEIEGPAQVCPSAEEHYTIEAYGGAGFKWRVTGNGQITAGQGTNQIKVKWSSLIGFNPASWVIVEYDNCYLGCKGQDSIAVRLLYPFNISGPVERCADAYGTFNSRLSTFQNLNCNWNLYAPDGSLAWTSPSATTTAIVAFNKGSGYYRLVAIPADLTQTCSERAEWTVKVADNPPKPVGIDGERYVCPNTPYAYDVTGSTPRDNYQWLVQNGSTAVTTVKGNPQVFSWGGGTPRRLAVQQISSDGLGCLSDTVQINLQTLTAPAISGTNKVCEDETGQYSIPPQRNLDIQWKIIPATAGAVSKGQGTEQVEIFWTQAGGHAVEVTVCGLKTVYPVSVAARPAPLVLHASGVCPGKAIPVQTTTAFNSYDWKTESGSHVSSSITPLLGPGAYALVVTDPNNCSGTVAFNIDTFPTPNLSVTTADPTGFCNNERYVNLKALVTADGDYTYEWFQDGNPVGGNTKNLVTNQYGLYTVQVTNQYGCTATDGPIEVFVYCGGVCHNPSHAPKCQPGDVGFSINATAPCDSFEFNLQAGPLYQPGSARWAFGESGSKVLGASTDENPGFKFPNAGQYIVVLYAKLTNGATCTVLDSVNVEAVAKFSSDPSCMGSATAFKDVSTFLPGSGISQWQWDFGDPGSGAANNDTQRNPGHTFNTATAYPVSLTITANSGCTSTVTKTTNIPGGTPVAFAAPLNNCVGNALEFNAIAAPDVTKIQWDFGQSSTGAANDANGPKVYHNYTTAGTYTVKATSTNVYGCTESFSQSVLVSANTLNGTITPNNPAPLCEGKTQALTAPNGVSWLWSDKTTTARTLTVTKEGVYKVTVTDAKGCTYAPPPVKLDITPAPDALIKALLKNDLGQVVGTAYPTLAACQGEDVFLRTDGSGSYGYNWSNGKNTREIEFSKDRSNLLPVGVTNYMVTVTEFATGCTAVTDPFTVTINPVPAGLTISGTSACAGKPLTLTYTGPTPPNWQLIWSTGQKGTQLTTAADGVYHIRAINEFGCSAKSNDWLVRPGPAVSAIPGGCHRRCKPDTVCLSNLPNVASWQWFYNGAAIPGATTSQLIARQNGSYWAELTDFFGCKATSDPLTLDLYDGFGDIKGKVWSDVNKNGVVDAGDTLVSGIFINLLNGGTVGKQLQSGAGGLFAFTNVLSTNYTVQIDAGKLPGGWQTVIDKADVGLVGCNALADCALLIRFDCQKTSAQLNFSACANDSIPYLSTFIKTGETRNFTLTNRLGCDSIVTVTVLSLAASTGNVTARACPGSSYTYQGVAVPAGTSQNFTLKNQAGCDSVVTVSVVPLATSLGSFSVKVCPGSAYTYNGTAIPAGTTRDFTLKNYLGCDSVVTVSVQALPVSTGAFTAKVCPGSSFTYQGVALPAGASQNFTLKNYLGCDSVVTVSVQALPVSTGAFTAKVCPGSSFTYQGVALPVGVSQNFTLKNYLGCDSVVTVSVQALPVSTGAFTAQVCAGGSYMYQGVAVPAGTNRNFTLKNYLGCDSVVTLSVQALPPLRGSFQARVCPGESYDYQGVVLAAGETKEVLVKTAGGCDSIVTVSVKANTPSTHAFSVRICAGATYDYYGVELRPGDTQEFRLSNWQGCDSLVTVTVQALPPLSSSFSAKVCEGETFTYQGVVLQAGETRPFYLRTPAGCDSTVTVTVRAVAKSDSSISVRICPGSTFSYQNKSMRPGDTQQFRLSNWQGCDSLVIVSVAALETSVTSLQKAVCKGTSYLFNGTPVAAGQTRSFTLTGANGCDSTVVVSVAALPEPTFDLQTAISCPNTPTGSLVVRNPGGSPGPYHFSLDGKQYQDSTRFVNLKEGTYRVFVRDSNDCVAQKDTQIAAQTPLQAELPDAVLDCDSSQAYLSVKISGDTTGLRLLWWNGSRSRATFATEGGPVWIELQNRCENLRREANVRWGDLDADDSFVYVPNIFKPDADEQGNAMFRPFFAPALDILAFRFEVYDRWGNRLHQSEQADADGWGGGFRSRDMEPGVYVWFVEARIRFCGRDITLKRKGDVTILR